MSFVKFEKSRTRTPLIDRPTLTVGKTGILGLNVVAADKLELRKFSHVTLYYDPENMIIGIKPSNDSIPENFKLRDRKGSGLDITARSFLQRFGIDYSETKRYDVEWLEDEKMLTAQVQ